MALKTVIKSEEDAFNAIQKFLDGEAIGNIQLKGWPKLQVRLVGDKFDATITPTVMKSFIELQTLVLRSYALSQYGTDDTRKISKEERDELEIEVKVEEGSSVFEVDFQSVLMKFAETAGTSMTPELTAITILGLGVLWVGKTSFTGYLNHRKEIRMAEVRTEEQREMLTVIQEQTKQESARLQTLTKLLVKQPALEQISRETYDTRTEMLRGFATAESATVDDVTISGEVAKEVVTNARRKAVEKRLDGFYRILRVDSSNPEEFRVKVRRHRSSTEFEAVVEDTSLDSAKKETLQYAEWERTTVYLNINAKVLDGEIRQAVVLDVIRADPPA